MKNFLKSPMFLAIVSGSTALILIIVFIISALTHKEPVSPTINEPSSSLEDISSDSMSSLENASSLENISSDEVISSEDISSEPEIFSVNLDVAVGTDYLDIGICKKGESKRLEGVNFSVNVKKNSDGPKKYDSKGKNRILLSSLAAGNYTITLINSDNFKILSGTAQATIKKVAYKENIIKDTVVVDKNKTDNEDPVVRPNIKEEKEESPVSTPKESSSSKENFSSATSSEKDNTKLVFAPPITTNNGDYIYAIISKTTISKAKFDSLTKDITESKIYFNNKNKEAENSLLMVNLHNDTRLSVKTTLVKSLSAYNLPLESSSEESSSNIENSSSEESSSTEESSSNEDSSTEESSSSQESSSEESSSSNESSSTTESSSKESSSSQVSSNNTSSQKEDVNDFIKEKDYLTVKGYIIKTETHITGLLAQTATDIAVFSKGEYFVLKVKAITKEKDFTSGFFTKDGRTYYLKTDGTLATNWYNINLRRSFFSDNGVLSSVHGIDVSSYQNKADKKGKIYWDKVAKDNIEFAIIRAGFRGYGTGVNKIDSFCKENIEGAQKAGLDVGLYFFSQAINVTEAAEEASILIDLAKKYNIKMPLVIDTELIGSSSARADKLSVSQRTTIVKAFCETIKKAGFEPMIYASKSFYLDNLNGKELSNYKLWIARYPADANLYETPNISAKYHIWQYASDGKVNGITGYVDMNSMIIG